MGLLQIIKKACNYSLTTIKVAEVVTFQKRHNIPVSLLPLVFLALASINISLYAEGTKTWSLSATDYSFLKVNTAGSYAFAGYGLPANKRLYIHISDPENEVVYIGLSSFVDENYITPLATAYQFRIKSPSGAIVHGPYAVSSPNLTSYSMAAAGPQDIVGATGYPTTNAMWKFDPSGKGLTPGDYYIEFDRGGSIRWFDITVATKGPSPSAINGRIWSQAWAVRANDGFGDGQYFDEAFNGVLIAYDGKYATKIDFNNSGLRPLEGQFSFNQTGPGNTGNITNDRKSVNGVNATNPFHKTFLNMPDPAVYPLQVKGVMKNLPLKVTDPASPNIEIEVTQPGKVEIVLDFGGGTKDRRLFADVVAGVNQIPWDGKTGQGIAVKPADYPIPVFISYTQGETHFTAYDVEGLDNGFQVYTYASNGVIGPRLQFWDDSNIPDSPGSAGASDPQVNVDSGATTRRRWNNNNYGDINTINTWWYAYRDAQSSTVLLPGDYGDAPASYGLAAHKIPDTPTVYLGATAPDKENQAPATLDGTGDDTDNSDDEDAFTTPLQNFNINNSSYSLNVSCHGEGATVAGWIDFNLNGVFDTAERTTNTCTSGNAALVWSAISTNSTGTSYLRLRIASNASDITAPDSGASDGEVEDYPLNMVRSLSPFVCDGTPYTVINDPSELQSLDRNTLAVTSLGNLNPAVYINGTGYNALDNLIYGFYTGNGTAGNTGISTGSIIRYGSGNHFEDLGLPTGTGSFNPLTYIGTMDNAGKFYAINNTTLFIVDIGNKPDANTLTFTPITRTGDKSTPADITFSIYDDALYGVKSGKLVRITKTGAGSVVPATGDNLPANAGGAWSSADGSLYFYNNVDGELYNVDVSQSPAIVAKVGNVTANGKFDATACTPPSLKKDASVSETYAGSTFSYTYTIANAFNFPITVGFSDVLPATLTYDLASLSNNSPGGGSIGTFNDSTLTINNIGLAANSQVSFTVTVNVSSAINSEQNIDNQANISYGAVNVNSDDPDTPAIEDPTRVHVLPVDFGDAPDSYGDAAHGVPTTTTVYLGATKPDIDTNSRNAANGGTDGTGDDNEAIDDEDEISSLPKLTDIDNNYSLDVVVNNTSGSTANLVGWIDFDGNGVFDADEAATLPVNSGVTGGSVTLSWSNIPADIKAGDTFVRLRLTTDNTITTGQANSSLPTGAASDGEVEDYAITIEVGGFPVKGRVFNDSNIDGINNGASEKGISGLPLVLLDVNHNTCVSTRTNADGYYNFFPVIPGDYRLYEASRETVPTPQNCLISKAKDPAGYRSTTTNAIAQFSVVNAEVDGKDFGDVREPGFSPDHSGTILAGNVAFYTHQFVAKSTGTVNFNTSNSSSITPGWSSILYQDTNCNNHLDGIEANAPAGTNLATVAGQKICLINKVYAPPAVKAGETFSNIITADFDFNGNTIAGTATLKVTDTSKASANSPESGNSRLTLRKTVQNITPGATTAETETLNSAKPGDLLKYRIYYSNTGTGNITELDIKDTVPAFTTLNGSPECGLPLPASLNSCTGNVSGDTIEWIFGAGDVLQGGAKGVVSYEVKVE